MTQQPYSALVCQVIDEVMDRRIQTENGVTFLESRLVAQDEPGYRADELLQVLLGEIAAEVSLRLLFRTKGRD